MPKRFIDTDAHKTELRRLDLKTRFTVDWLWRNCDCAGVWQTDQELFRFEAGFTLNLEVLLKSCPWVKRLPNGNVFLPEFVQVNYGELKPGYNPHKPVFRSLEANGIQPLTLQFEPLTKTCPSLEGEEEGEDNSEKKGREVKEHDATFEAVGKKKEVRRTAIAVPRATTPDEFKAQCAAVAAEHPDLLPPSLRKAFFDYWTERDAQGHMRLQAEKHFEIPRRMTTWRTNAEKRGEIPAPAPERKTGWLTPDGK